MEEFSGISWKQATKALRVYGPNEVKIKRSNPQVLLYKQFKSPVTLLLLSASVISFLLGNQIDAIIILLIVLINSFFAFYQQYQANHYSENLKSYIKKTCLAIRDGVQNRINTSTVVPEDVLIFRAGDIVCADCYVLQQKDLLVDESIITGESEAIRKIENKNLSKKEDNAIVLSGSKILEGECIGLVYATGEDTLLGKSERLGETSKKPSVYEQRLKNLSNKFVAISLLSISFIIILKLAFNTDSNIVSIILFAIAITISIIPEALPLVANLTLANSSLKLAEKKVVIKNNSTIEELGNIDYICSDKTGTLTENSLMIDFYSTTIIKSDFLEYAYLASTESQDPVDKCITDYLKEIKTSEQSEFLISETSFDPVKKFSSRKFKDFEIIKGSSEYIFSIAKPEDPKIIKEIIEQESRGLRTVSIAIKENDKPKYIGSFFFYDKIKDDAKEVIHRTKQLGVNVKILSGDSKEVCFFVAKKVGLVYKKEQIINANDLDYKSRFKLLQQIKTHQVISNCSSEQKYLIIQSLQREHSVGYIGDGINDVPALKIANVGIAVANATDIAKDEADIVLVGEGLEVITNGIEEGRAAFERIERYLRESLAGNFGGFLSIGILSTFLRFLPMLPIQILLSNLLTDAPLLASTRDRIEPKLLRKPKHHSQNRVIFFALIMGLVSCFFDLAFFYVVRNQEPASIQTQWFLLSVLTEIVALFSLREIRHGFLKSFFRIPSIVVILAIWSVITSLVLAIFGLGSAFVGIGIEEITLVVFIALVYFVANEIIKTPLGRLMKID